MKNHWLCFSAFLVFLMPAPCHSQPETRDDILRASIGPDGRQHVRIVGGSYFFKPSHIIVKANVPVELSASMEPGIVPHTLVIDAAEAGVAIDTSLGTEARTFVFTPSRPGKYPFYCRNRLLFFESHREKGMEGILEVVE